MIDSYLTEKLILLDDLTTSGVVGPATHIDEKNQGITELGGLLDSRKSLELKGVLDAI